MKFNGFFRRSTSPAPVPAVPSTTWMSAEEQAYHLGSGFGR